MDRAWLLNLTLLLINIRVVGTPPERPGIPSGIWQEVTLAGV